MRIWYNKTASKRKVKGGQRVDVTQNRWQQHALPLGNGTLGITVSGEPYSEGVYVNEKTLWTGGPSPKRPNYNGGNLPRTKGGKAMKDVFNDARERLKRGENADDICKQLVGDTDGYGSYQCAGIWRIRSRNNKVENYSLALDFDKAEAIAMWRKDSQRFVRNAFVSYPDKVAVVEQKSAVPCDWELTWVSRVEGIENRQLDKNSMLILGELKDNRLKYAMSCRLVTNGEITIVSSGWKVQKATQTALIFTYKTDYCDNYPTYRTGQSEMELKNEIFALTDNAVRMGVDKLRANHAKDWHDAYSTMELHLGEEEQQIPTDRLLRSYSRASEKDKRCVEQLLFAYGRYLMLSSSRKNDILPSNLQGIWNCTSAPAWSSDYHLNINLQMNYWMAPLTGLGDCAMPLVRYVQALRKPGRVTAATYCGIGDGESESGYLYHTQNTPFGWTCPGWDFCWGWSTVAPAWILHNVYDVYLFNAREELLKDIYPMIKEATLTYDALLDKSGDRWVTSPSYSPEHGPITHGNTYEQIFMWQLYADAIDAASRLGVDSDRIEAWKETLARLKPIAIGPSNQILEWYHEQELGTVGEKRHRHVSHLMGLYPCSLFDETDREVLEATRVSLEDRGDKSTGWATALRLCLWARLYDGDRAFKLVERLISSNIYQNLWDTHPPFQIDGNFGYCAGVCEMLAHSHHGAVKLLPTLPTAWSEGSIRGLGVRGGFTIDFNWKNCYWKEVSVHAQVNGEFVLECIQDVQVTDGNVVEIPTVREGSFVRWQCEKGHVYRVCKRR